MVTVRGGVHVCAMQLSEKRRRAMEAQEGAVPGASNESQVGSGGTDHAQGGDCDDARDNSDYGDSDDGEEWTQNVTRVGASLSTVRQRVLARLDQIRYACAEGALDELAGCADVILSYASVWPESDGKYEALMALASFLATSDEAVGPEGARPSSMTDDGTRQDVGWRHLIIDPMRLAAESGAAHEGVAKVVMELPTHPAAWRQWRSERIADGRLTQRNGRIDTRDNVSEEKNGYPNDKWERKLNHLHLTGAKLRSAMTYQDVQDVVFSMTQERRKSDQTSQGFSELRAMWVVQLLVRLLPRVRHESMHPVSTPAIRELRKLVGRERAEQYHDHLQVNCGIILRTTLALLPQGMLDALHRLCDARRDWFSKEASICEDERQLRDMARHYYALREFQVEKGSTPARQPSGERKELKWWTGVAHVIRKGPGAGQALLDEPCELRFEKAHASTANEAMLLLVDALLLPLFASTPEQVEVYFKGGKKEGKKRARDEGGLSDKAATHFERMLACVHLINLLDVWRRGTDVFCIR